MACSNSPSNIKSSKVEDFFAQKSCFDNRAQALLRASKVPGFLEIVEVPWPFALDLMKSCEQGKLVMVWSHASIDSRTRHLEVEVLPLHDPRAGSIAYCWGPAFALTIEPAARPETWLVNLWF